MIYRLHAYMKDTPTLSEQLVLIDVRPWCVRQLSLHEYIRGALAVAWCCEPEKVEFYNVTTAEEFVQKFAQGPQSDGYARLFEVSWGPDGIGHSAPECNLLLLRPHQAHEMHLALRRVRERGWVTVVDAGKDLPGKVIAAAQGAHA